MKKIPLKDLLRTQFPEIDEKELYARIMCGEVYAGNEKLNNPGILVYEDQEIEPFLAG